MRLKSREKEAALIRSANRAAAVGRLMMGELSDWEQFLNIEADDLETLPRRALKSGKADVRSRLSREISNFCLQNFEDMNENKLSILYEEIKAHRGLELPLKNFEKSYAKIRTHVLKGAPKHCTVSISLWGLQFKFPEDMLSKDIMYAIERLRASEKTVRSFETSAVRDHKRSRVEISALIRGRDAYARMCLLACSNLLEAFLNGLAWDFAQDPEKMAGLSKRKKDLIEDGEIKKKLRNYPEIISGRPLCADDKRLPDQFLDRIKPVRDSLVHPSPFTDPNRYGGRDKLELIYRIDSDTVQQAASVCCQLMIQVFQHINGKIAQLPPWLEELGSKTATTKPHPQKRYITIPGVDQET